MADPTTTSRRSAARALPTRAALVVLLAAGVLIAVLLSLAVGSKPLSPNDIWTAITGEGSDYVRTVLAARVPRTLVGLLVGACLAIAGMVMQGVTRNPLGDPGLLGVNVGAAAGIVLSTAFLGIDGHQAWVALPGALAAMVAVSAMGTGRHGVVPIRLVLAGTVVTAVLTAVIQGITLTHGGAFDDYRYWAVGSLAGGGADVADIAPYAAVGIILTLVITGPLNALALGEATAVSFGTDPARTRWLGIAAATILCGAATAAAGPIAFVGLAVPHLARALVGADHRWQLPAVAAIGPILLLGADVLGRVLIRPQELQVGVVTAFAGAPVLLWLVRRMKGAA